jgi:hypothetical protein
VIVKLFSSGKSFKALGRYLTTDPKAQTSERVGWTHTLNLANDHVPSAVGEMLWTYRAADMLKRQAGIRAGGRPLENPVKHFSLSWHPSEQPDREHMIASVDKFLKHMGWSEHQAVIVNHTDRHPHVHVMLNAVHPETGRILDTGFEKRRAQEFALAYERENGKIFCEERLLPAELRTPSPTRQTWQKLRETERQHDKIEIERVTETPDYFEREDPKSKVTKEWGLLKTHQREEREAFFVEGKQAFREVRNAVFREVRTEFRDEWRAWFQAKRNGLDTDHLDEMKADILKRQNEALDPRRTAACAELRERRDAEYKDLLLEQKQQRALLTDRQEQGLSSPDLLDLVYGRGDHSRDDRPAAEIEESRETARSGFLSSARETCERPSEQESEISERSDTRQPYESPATESFRVHDGVNVLGGLGLGALGAIANIGEKLFDGFLGGGEQTRHHPRPQPGPPKRSARNDSAARSTESRIRSAEEQATEAEQLHEYWHERRRQRGRDRD